MPRLLEVVFMLILSASFFFLGVKYSDKVKENVGWIFEYKESEVELPKLSNTSDISSKKKSQEELESDSSLDNLDIESQDALEQGQLPEEDQNIIPAIYDE